MPSILSRVAGFLLTLLVFLAPVRLSAQVSIADLPPVDQVFRLSSEAVSGDEVALTWQISKGFYLYRHSLKLTNVSGLSGASLDIPTGKKAHDEFFGDVETYRDRLRVGVLGSNAGPIAEFTIRYQGCADVGVCYPPQTKTLRVPLPVAAAAAGATNIFGRPVVAPDQALPADRAFTIVASPLGADRVRVSLIAVDGYYLYQRQIKMKSLTPTVSLGAPVWPRARMYDDPEFGRVPVYFGAQDLDIPLRRSSAAAGALKLSVAYQGCKENGICYPPMQQTLSVVLPAGAAVASPAAAPAVVMAPGAETAPEVLATSGATPMAPSAAAAATPADTSASVPPREMPSKPINTSMSMGLALLLALLGGLILNLMPCVLPVLSLKALSLAQHGSGDARKHALAYTAGVLTCFLLLGGLLLALRGAGDSVGWAFQMQQPLVITVLALLLFALGLSLSGVWYAGGRWLGYGQTLTTSDGWRSDFFTGLLAVVVATPCVAPFMGAAMAWAFFAPTLQALLVFLALGLGLALPFLVIGFFPAVARILPKPGPWMETFKQFMAFPMYLSAIWLLWVLAQQRGSSAAAWCLVAALLIAFAAWAWTRAARVESSVLRVLALVAVLGVAWPMFAISRTPPVTAVAAGEHVVFDESRIASLRAGGQPVFVNITADWCISCKVNEKAVLSQPSFRSLLASTNTVYMVGDYTNVSDSLTAYLQSFNAVGVPLYVYYPADVSREPVILPTILTPTIVRDAINSR